MAKKTKIIIKNKMHISLIAAFSGFRDWRSLWNANKALKKKRENPLILFHGDRNPDFTHKDKDGNDQAGAAGDTVEVPTPKKKQASAVTETHNPFSVPTDQVCLRLRVLDENLKPLKDAKYELVVDGMKFPRPPKDGPADNSIPANGLIDSNVRKTAQNGKLVVSYEPPTPPPAAKDWPKDIPGTSSGAIPTDALEMVYQDDGKCKHYAQAGRSWSSRFLGSANTATIAEQGCAVCCVAMVLKYYGRAVDPESIDEHLDKNEGYLGNLLLWDKAYACGEAKDLPKITRKASVSDATKFNALLDDRIKKDLPTIAHVDTNKSGRGNHFVVIVGKGKDGYIMNDPGAGGGDGATNPTLENTVEKTKRKSGYTIKKLVPFDVSMPPPAKVNADVSPKKPNRPLPLTPPEAKAKAEAEAEAKKVKVAFQLQIGRLDPIKDKSGAPDDKFTPGVQQRLNNLGFDAGPVDGVVADDTKASIKRFQRRFKLSPVDGDANDATLAKLKEFHDGPNPPTAPALT